MQRQIKTRPITVDSMLSAHDFRVGCRQVFQGTPFNPDYKWTKSPWYYEWGRQFGVWLKTRGIKKCPKFQNADRTKSERAVILIYKFWREARTLPRSNS